MTKTNSAAWSSVGKKVIMAITGLAMILFLVGHLVGNIFLYVGPESFNAYAHKLIKLGPLLYVIEAGLLTFFVLHIVSGVSVALGKKRARPQGYKNVQHAGGKSRKTISSRTMIWSGIILLVFTVVHLKTFKFGAGEAEGYTTEVHGEPARDLYRLVQELFSPQHPYYTLFYVVCMVFLGFHLRHAFWSALQSLGALNQKTIPLVYTIGVILAILLAAGFLALPIWMYLTGGAS